MCGNIKRIEFGSGTNDGLAISRSIPACYENIRPMLTKTGTPFFVPDVDVDRQGRTHPSLKGGKRAFDIFVSLLLLILLSPLMLLAALVIMATMGRPIFFTQVRPGLGGRPFPMIKFRSMYDALDAQGSPLPDEERLGRLGRLLRSTSLDELPELLNVLRGDMSLVGPRPLLMEYLPLYSADQSRRHQVRPGLTGLAQIGGRNALSWDEKFALDLRYVDQWSMWLDLKILSATVWKVVTRQGISHADHATAPKFQGNRDNQ
jgi:lipopolysaccharide/colanic/teichoic acid biosynthesis glycosyltransferase